MTYDISTFKSFKSGGSKAPAASSGNPESMLASFLSGQSEVPLLDRIISGGMGGIIPAVGGAKNAEDSAPFINSLIGRSIGTMGGHPWIGSAAGSAVGEAERQFVKGLRGQAESNPGMKVAGSAGASILADAVFSGVTRAPFAKELAGKALQGARGSLQKAKNALIKTGAEIPREEVVQKMTEFAAKIGLPTEAARFKRMISKEIDEDLTEVGIKKVIALSEKFNNAYTDLSKRKITGGFKTALGDARAYFSNKIKTIAKEQGIEGIEEGMKKVSSINKQIRFLGGPAGSTGTVVGEISGMGSLGYLMGGPQGAVYGGLAGAALSNPVTRNVMFKGLTSGPGIVAQEAMRAGLGETARGIARDY